MHDFFATLSEDDALEVAAAMKDIAANGIEVARHLRGEIYEARAEAASRSFRLLFAQETRFILLALSAFEKRTQKTPLREIELAESRLAAWRARGRQKRPPTSNS